MTDAKIREPAPTPEEPTLDIHKPKPVHSLRDFLGEFATIVLGVAVALSGEQAVEALHWRHEVADTREALTEELTNNLRVLRLTQREEGCSLAHTDALAAWAQGRAPANPNRQFGGPSLADFQTGVWDIAKTSQVAAHIPLQDRLAYARLYANFETLNYLVSSQRDNWRELTRFADKTTLSTAEAAQLSEAISVSHRQVSIWRGNAAGPIQRAKALGAREPAVLPPMRVPADCGPGRIGPLGARPT